jgi:hypothetical protein
MTEHNFAAWTRLAVSPSRRDLSRALTGIAIGGIWSTLLGVASSDARKNRRKRRNKNKRNRRKGNGATSPPPCTPACAGNVCGDDGCGGSCGSCGTGQLCAAGACVTGQGTCAAGDDVCVDTNDFCGGSDVECHCHTTMSNQTRCGERLPLTECETCVNDAECAAFFPAVPGVFCVKPTGTCCGGACFAPCRGE